MKSVFSWEVGFVLFTTILFAGLYFLVVPFLEFVELKSWDLHFKERGVVQPSGTVAFVTIDEESVNREGRWPWPRRKMAQLLKSVEEHGALVMGLDMGFFEPDLNLRQKAILDVRDRLKAESANSQDFCDQLETIAQGEDDDKILAATVADLTTPLVLGHFFYFDANSYAPPPPPEELLRKAQCPIVRSLAEPPPGKLIEAIGLEANIPLVDQASRFMGSFNVFADPDGCVRWMPLVIRYEGRLFPSLALQMLAAALPEMPMMVTVDERGIVDVRLGSVSIPTNSRGEMLLNYYGPSYTFPHYSASALLHGEVPEGCLDGKLVVIGNTTVGLFDMRPTPFAPIYPGVELHCTVMENILQQHFLQRSDRTMPFFDMAALLALAVVFLILQSFLRGTPLAAVVTSLLVGYVLMTHYLFLRQGVWLNHIYPPLNLVTAYLGTTVHRYLREEREKRKVRQTFSLYVHGSVVEEMLAHPERLRLGGEKKELTVLFSDIRGFTTLSEKLPPEELVPQLNGYLTQMTQVVFDNHGTLDKYIGDAVMAIFGAPLSQPDHPKRACATALDMMKELAILQAKWREQNLPELKIGVGINTGLMMVGNMGSENRFDYTVLGDNVNLASRLEGLTKMYGVSIVVSQSTWDAVKGEFVGRELDVVRVKGKQQPVGIYQVMGREDLRETLREPLEAYGNALTLYRQGRWEEAKAAFTDVERWWPEDAPSRLYQKRCTELLATHPGEAWSFVTILDHK